MDKALQPLQLIRSHRSERRTCILFVILSKKLTHTVNL